MHTALSFNVASFFLLVAASLLIPYTMKDRMNNCAVSPAQFLMFSISVLMLGAFFIALLGMKNGLCALALAIGMSASVFSPVAATAFFISLLFIRPWEALPHNMFLSLLPRLMAGITLGVWLFHALLGSNQRIRFNPACLFYICFLAWLLAGAFIKGSSSGSVSFFIETFLPISVLAFLVLNSIRRAEDLKVITSALIISVLGVVASALSITLAGSESGGWQQRLSGAGLWGNANDLGSLIVFVIPLCAAPWIHGGRPLRRKLLSAACVLFLIFALYWSQSRGAFIALFSGLIFYILFSSKMKRGLIAGLVLLLALPLLFSSVSLRRTQDLEVSTTSRTNYLIAGVKMAKDNPLLGIGINNYADKYEQYTPAFSEWGKRTAHSSWVLALAEGGVIGLGLFTLIYLSAFRFAWRLRRAQPQYLMLIVSYGVAMSFLSHTYLFLPYIGITLCMAAAYVSLPHIRSTQKSVSRGRMRSGSGYKFPSRTAEVHSGASTFGYSALLILSCFLICSESRAEISSMLASPGAQKEVADRQPNLSQKIELSGSRGEVLLFLIHASGKGCSSLQADISGITSDRAHLNFYEVATIRTKHPSFPGAFVGEHSDPLLPLNNGKICIPARLKHTWILGELSIPTKLSPGEYSFSIHADGQNLPAALKIWPMQIPEKPALPIYSEMTPWFLLLGHFGKWAEGEAELALQYRSAMEEHRIFPLKSTLAPLQINEGRLDLDNHPDKSGSFRRQVIRARPAFAYYDFPTVGASGFEPIDYTKAEPYFKAIQSELQAAGEVKRAIIYLWDEPKPEAMPELIKLSKFVHHHAPLLRQLVTITLDKRLTDTVSIFSPVMDYLDSPDHPSPDAYRQFQKTGGEVWSYVSCMSHGCEALADSGMPDLVIDRPSVYVRSIGWIAARYNLDAFLYYSVNNGYQFYPKRDPWESLWDFSGNGDGTLFYPGRPGERGISRHRPLPSLRLKLLRETSFDAEYIRWMNSLRPVPDWWTQEYQALVSDTSRWSRDYTAYQKLREKAGDYLSTKEAVPS